MDEGAERDDLTDHIPALFALVTGRLEDAAGIAGECQAPLPISELHAKSAAIKAIVGESMTISPRQLRCSVASARTRARNVYDK